MAIEVAPGVHWLAKRIADLRLARGWNQEQLGVAAGVSSSNISKIERAETERPQTRTLDAIARAFGWADRFPLLAGEEPPPPAKRPIEPHAAGPVEDLRPLGTKPLPVFAWGSCGDPRDRESSPDPIQEEYPPLGKELLIGPHGFSVIVRGDSMSARGLQDGDQVWINPEKPPRLGGIVVARCWSGDGAEVGMVVKVWKSAKSGEGLYSDTGRDDDAAALACVRFDVIGPVVWVTRGFPPR